MIRAFIVGAPRSGTTLLQSFLGSHPDLVTCQETHFFQKLTMTRLKGLGMVSTRFGPRNWERLQQVIPTAGRRPAPFIRSYVRGFIDAMDTLATEAACEGWVEKTPDHTYEIDVIDRYIPDAGFVHILREGPDVIASIYRSSRLDPARWGRAYSLERCVKFWIDAVQATDQFKTRRNHHVIMYRDLVLDPEETLRSICGFLNVAFEEEMLDRGDVAGELGDGDPWHSNLRRQLSYQPNATFEAALDADQRSYVLRRIAHVNTHDGGLGPNG